MRRFNSFVVLLVSLCFLSSCLDRDFDEPPLGGADPAIDPADIMTMAELSDIYQNGQIVKINSDKYLSVVVSADDRSGNIYKTLIVEDEFGGINVQIDDFELWNEFPVGRRIFIDLSQLYISDYNNLPQIGFEPYLDDGEERMSRIPSELVDDFIIGGSYDNEVTPRTVRIGDINSSYLNTLIKIDDVEFLDDELNFDFADAANLRTLNRNLQDCFGSEIVVRTSGYADFAGERLPQGKGSITAVLGVFGRTYQLTVRDVTEVQLDGDRCFADTGTSGGLSQQFDNMEDFEPLDFEGWTNVATKGTRVWIKKSFSGNGFAETEAYQDSNAETECWLITPEINTAETKTMRFLSAMAFYKHDGLEVMISTDFSGDPNAATWTDLNTTLASSGQDNYDWVESGTINLESYGSKVYVGFKYSGTSAQNTTKFRIDDLLFE